MTVSLQFYLVDEATGLKTRIENVLDLGSLFKGSESKFPIAIYNDGDETAINPRVSIVEYYQDGKDFKEAVTWKKLSLSKNTDYNTFILLPDIKPKSWLEGKDIVFEDFSQYSLEAGTRPDQNWQLWSGNSYTWEVYSGYLQHNVDSQYSRALWGVLPEAKDFEFSMKITVRNSVFAGVILRHIGDYDTGYIVLVQGMAQYFTSDMSQGEGVIQVWSGKFSQGIENWQLLHQTGTIGIRGTHDYFKVRLQGKRFDFWYQNEYDENPLYSWIDSNDTYKGAASPVIASHPSTGSILIYFDDIKMETPNPEGRIWVRDLVNKDTKLYGRQNTIFKVEYGGE